MTNAALRGKPDAGNPHVRFDEGEVALAATPRRGSLLYNMTKKLAIGLVLLGVSANAANVAIGGYVYLNSDDPGGQYSFAADKGRWYYNGAVTNEAPTSGKKYLVQSTGTSRRILRVASNAAFAGDSLTLDYGEIRASSGNPYTVEDLIVYNGLLGCADPMSILGIDGCISIQSNGELHVGGSGRRFFWVYADVTGDSTAKIVVDASSNESNSSAHNAPFWCAGLSGDNSGFSGRIVVNGLKTGYAWPSALVVTQLSALGHGDSGGNSVVTLDDRCALFGNGLGLTNASYSVTAGATPRIGSWADGSDGYGLKIDGGVSIITTEQDTTLFVTNKAGTTILGNVILSGFGKVVVQSGNVRFAAGYNNPSLPVEVCPGVTVTCDDGAVLGSLSSTDGTTPVAVTMPSVDVTTLNRSNTGFTNALVSATVLDVNDFVRYVGVRREEFVVRDNAAGVPTLYWQRDADDGHGVFRAKDGTNWNGYTTAALWTQNGTDSYTVVPENDYIIENGKNTRLETASTNAQFAGHSLSVLGGGELCIRGSGSTASTSDLQLFENSHSVVRAKDTIGTFAGNATIRTSLGGYANFETEAGTLNLTAQLHGYGNARYRGLNGTSYAGKVYVTGDNRDFTGRVALPHSAMTVKFASEDSLGGNPARFAANGFEVGDGVTLWCDATYQFNVTQPNRGVKLLGVANVDVASGSTCVMTTPISGAGSICKKNAGTLRLGNDGSTFSGGVSLQAGVIEVVSTNAFGASALVYSGGTLRIECEEPLVICGETPISWADGAVQTPVPIEIKPSGSDWKGDKRALLRFPAAVGITDENIANFVSYSGRGASSFRWSVVNEENGTIVFASKNQGLMIFVR